MEANAKYSSEPWVVDDCPDAYGHCTLREADDTSHGNTDLQPIATVYANTNAFRITSCVNACAGIPTEELEKGIIGDMRKALEDLVNCFAHVEGNNKGNKAKTDIIKYNPEVREALVAAQALMTYRLGGE